MDIKNIIIDKLKAYHQNDINGISELDYDEIAKDIKIAINKNTMGKPIKCPECGSDYELGDCWKYRCSNEECGYTPKHLG